MYAKTLILLLIVSYIEASSSTELTGKQLFIGQTDFLEFITENDIYVDKTQFLKELMLHESLKYVITRPRKWGKTLNLNMIKRFFELEIDYKTGFELYNKSKVNKHLFGTNTTKILKISEDTEFVEKYQGQYPVIHLDFGGDYGENTELIKSGLVTRIRSEFDRHKYVLNSSIGGRDSTLYSAYLYKPLSNFAWQEMENSVKFLSQVLYRHFNKYVIILIDNYDEPIIKAYEIRNSCTADIFDSFRRCLNSFYRFLVTKNYLIKGVLMGRYPNAYGGGKEFLIPEYYGMLKKNCADTFCKYFGFTRKEINVLLERVDLEHGKKHLSQWYGGHYCFENQDNVNKSMVQRQPKVNLTCEMFNPYSVMNYIITNGEIDAYWIKSGVPKTIKYEHYEKSTIDFIASLLPHRQILYDMALIDSESYDPFLNMTQMLSSCIHDGFLIARHSKKYNSKYILTVPNEEVRYFLHEVIKNAMEKRTHAYIFEHSPIKFMTGEFIGKRFVKKIKSAINKLIKPKFWYFNGRIYKNLVFLLLKKDMRKHRMVCKSLISDDAAIMFIKPQKEEKNDFFFILRLESLEAAKEDSLPNQTIVDRMRFYLKRDIGDDHHNYDNGIMVCLTFSKRDVKGYYYDKSEFTTLPTTPTTTTKEIKKPTTTRFVRRFQHRYMTFAMKF